MRTIVLIDGQNLYHLAKAAWAQGDRDARAPYIWPSYDVVKLANALTNRLPDRSLAEIRFYTGVPEPIGESGVFWHAFWRNKLRDMRNRGVYVYTGRVGRGGQEKGVDVSLALELMEATNQERYEVAVIVSQDADFGPAVQVAKRIAKDQGRQLTFESAFPVGLGSSSRRGVPGTHWVHIDKDLYDTCLDLTDYR